MNTQPKPKIIKSKVASSDISASSKRMLTATPKSPKAGSITTPKNPGLLSSV